MYRYIIVDDEAMIRKGVQLKIGQTPSLAVSCAGEASNGLEALELMKRVAPDFVITDMKMKAMDGMVLLEEFSRLYPETPVIVISGYKLFDYVKQAIEKHAVGYVLKPFSAEEIAGQVEKAIGQIESRRRVSTLQRQLEHLEKEKNRELLLQAVVQPWSAETEARLKSAGFPVGDGCVLLSAAARGADFGEKLAGVCEPLALRWKCEVLDDPSGEEQHLVLLHAPESEGLSAAAAVLPQQIAAIAGEYSLVLCVSRAADSFRGANALYAENAALLRDAVPGRRVNILSPEQRPACSPVLSDDELHDLISYMKYYPARTAELLEKVFGRLDPARDPLGSAELLCRSLTEKVNAYAAKKGVPVADPTEGFCRKYLLCGSFDPIRRDFADYFHTVFSSIRLRENNLETLMQEIVSYIEKNCREKLTLQQIAEEFYISPSFCSSLLKENLGMTFNDYLNDIRLQTARRLLTETKLSVNKISDEAGYLNPKYFFKVFKKAEGYTPLEYRAMHAGEKNR